MILGVYVFFLRYVFPENPVRFYVHICSLICKCLIFMSENSLLANVCIALYQTLNKFLLAYLLTYVDNTNHAKYWAVSSN